MPEFFWTNRDSRALTYFVAEEEATGEIVGTVTGVDHQPPVQDPEHGSSLWCLAVDPQATASGHRRDAGAPACRAFPGARRAAISTSPSCTTTSRRSRSTRSSASAAFRCFAVKRKNPINEKLFSGPIEQLRRAQPLCPHHHRRGAPARHPCRGHRCRGRLLPPVLWRPLHPLPRKPVGADLRRRRLDLRRQGRHPAHRRRGRRRGARADRSRTTTPRIERLPRRARQRRGQAGARRTGPRRCGRARPHGRCGKTRHRRRRARSATACWSKAASRARICASSSSTTSSSPPPSARPPSVVGDGQTLAARR